MFGEGDNGAQSEPYRVASSCLPARRGDLRGGGGGLVRQSKEATATQNTYSVTASPNRICTSLQPSDAMASNDKPLGEDHGGYTVTVPVYTRAPSETAP